MPGAMGLRRKPSLPVLARLCADCHNCPLTGRNSIRHNGLWALNSNSKVLVDWR
jgi:hypothetical protein